MWSKISPLLNGKNWILLNMYMAQHFAVNEENWILLLYGLTFSSYLMKKIELFYDGP